MAKKVKEKNQKEINEGLIDFVNNSPGAFHATQNAQLKLLKRGFSELKEGDKWELISGKKYFVKKNSSAIVAFILGKGDVVENGIRLVGAHTDSPGLKVKPNPEQVTKNYMHLGVEIYGGPILPTWFDRDLSLAGRVTYLNKSNKLKSVLIDFKRPLAIVPSLAIHLDRKANEGRSIDRQKELPPLLMQFDTMDMAKSKSSTKSKAKLKTVSTFNELILGEIKAQKIATDVKKILEHDMFFYYAKSGNVLGAYGEFLTAPRLDNLASCYLGLTALLEHDSKSCNSTSMLVLNDHEECGSNSPVGAGGIFLKSVLERISGTGENYTRMVANSTMISADNAHALHSNYPERHDSGHMPVLNGGPVIKHNANVRYATTSETSALFASLCETNKIPYQKFVSRSDMPSGSTIGPISATMLGIDTLDVGLPTFGMHSIQEMTGSKDPYYLYRALDQFYGL